MSMVSRDLSALISEMMAPNPASRPTPDQILTHWKLRQLLATRMYPFFLFSFLFLFSFYYSYSFLVFILGRSSFIVKDIQTPYQYTTNLPNSPLHRLSPLLLLLPPSLFQQKPLFLLLSFPLLSLSLVLHINALPLLLFLTLLLLFLAKFLVRTLLMKRLLMKVCLL